MPLEAAARVILPAALRDSLTRAAEAAHPVEACGLLVGRRDGAGFVVDAVHPAVNLLVDSHPDRFEIDPRLRIGLQQDLRGSGRDVIGHWHSHPSGVAQPSPTDAAMAFEGSLLWLIIATDPTTGRVCGQGAFRATGRCGAPEAAFLPLETV
ncbi:M67 family metallopeptidase [Rhodospirillum rubrum]|uniref:Mov34/MPN/PAD-1 n=1 Tax=Rhodospirillum rubrum (strain ATCC 11170 / ATH 1.1.1 / DSM 467 / LMG 4362 / NCIMB 8255 / S1) TaxID=269796 RepID=Q2RVD1_RHORT|nr:M67 family metallopeptidase [Rhodospirillum rubrum]ABC21914.1 Mov34/MPN/PAD-1 [Rhodospirillum rubrum ATCC 11170]AEO47617.1 Mov34/MPN/PAD-1 [Rhodospirillum rubrum F11]MBK5953481.1 hypothetical protein [Rhodospirillum rubrum]QXG81572.1 M67 family metallopeptidase [Rhodospirillum rubrum]HAP98445.1 hypothetical protein [Rhodospirillum rubrum]